jgi:hypothetical protein
VTRAADQRRAGRASSRPKRKAAGIFAGGCVFYVVRFRERTAPEVILLHVQRARNRGNPLRGFHLPESGSVSNPALPQRRLQKTAGTRRRFVCGERPPCPLAILLMRPLNSFRLLHEIGEKLKNDSEKLGWLTVTLK